MALKEDLIGAAERAAAFAAKPVEGEVGLNQHVKAIGAAKTALEAAALVGAAITPGEINAALNELTAELEAAGVWHEAQTLAPVDFLRAVLRGVVGLRAENERLGRTGTAFKALEGHVNAIAAEITRSADERHTSVDDPGRRLAGRLLAGVEKAYDDAGIPHSD